MKIDFFHWRGLSAAAVALASLAVSCQDPIETPNPGGAWSRTGARYRRADRNSA